MLHAADAAGITPPTNNSENATAVPTPRLSLSRRRASSISIGILVFLSITAWLVLLRENKNVLFVTWNSFSSENKSLFSENQESRNQKTTAFITTTDEDSSSSVNNLKTIDASVAIKHDTITTTEPKQEQDHNDDIDSFVSTCMEAPVTLAVGLAGDDCNARRGSIDRLRTLLLSLEATCREQQERAVSLLLWLESSDHESFQYLQEWVQRKRENVTVSVVHAMNLGNVTERTQELSPPLTTSFIFRKFDFVKFWGIHDSASIAGTASSSTSVRFVLNIDVDVVLLQPSALWNVWQEGCWKLHEENRAFYVAGKELLQTETYHPGFTRYVNSGVAFVDLLRLKHSYNVSDWKTSFIQPLATNKTLTQKGEWPPEQWLWNAFFETHPQYLALFNATTHCNCATHWSLPLDKKNGRTPCRLAHYCNTGQDQKLWNATSRFTRSVGKYLQETEPELMQTVQSQEPVTCRLQQ